MKLDDMKKRFICGLGFPINSDNPIRIISDTVEDKDYYKFSDICNIMNEQEATIETLKKLNNAYYEKFAKIVNEIMEDVVIDDE